jgi:hypothetical protein
MKMLMVAEIRLAVTSWKCRRGLVILALFILWTSGACVKEHLHVGNPCFTKESLETVPWIVDELKQFKVPKSGGYHASVSVYHDQQFLVIGNAFLASPGSHIFNCDGIPIGSLGIGYIEFCDNSKLVAVLANEKY